MREQEGLRQLFMNPGSNANRANTPCRGEGEGKGKETQTKPSKIQTSDIARSDENHSKTTQLETWVV